MADTPLALFSDALAGVVSSVSASVVRVEARRRGNASGIAWSADGLVIASDHTVQRDDDLRVGLPSGETAPAELVGRDPSTDIALLRTEATLSVPTWADDVAVGHIVLSVGRHDDEAQTAVDVVTRRSGPWRTGLGGRVDAFVETGLRVYPGFSGSAIADARGQVVGMGTSHFGRRLALALPVATLRRVAGLLSEHGRVPHGYLGVSTQPVRLRDGGTGLLVVDVASDGPAEAAGVLVGDVLVGIGETAVAGPHDLMAALADVAGQSTAIRILRGGEPLEIMAEVATR